MSNVCEVHTIHPNEILGTSGILNNENAAPIAKGYTKIPPLVAAIVKLAEIKPIRTAANGIVSKSETAKLVK